MWFLVLQTVPNPKGPSRLQHNQTALCIVSILQPFHSQHHNANNYISHLTGRKCTSLLSTHPKMAGFSSKTLEHLNRVLETTFKKIDYATITHQALNQHLTSFWFREAFVQVKNYFLHKVLNVAVLRSSDKHHPVVGEAFHGGFLAHLGTMTKF